MAAQIVTPKITAPKVKKEPVAPIERVTETLKRAAIAGKISKQELETVANLANALQTFMSA